MNMAVCIVQDPPYLDRALGCEVGMAFSGVVAGIGFIGFLGTTRKSLHVRIAFMLVVRGWCECPCARCAA